VQKQNLGLKGKKEKNMCRLLLTLLCRIVIVTAETPVPTAFLCRRPDRACGDDQTEPMQTAFFVPTVAVGTGYPFSGRIYADIPTKSRRHRS
jgi:hypothetical protein